MAKTVNELTYSAFTWCFLLWIALGASEASEETVPGGQEEGGYSPESGQTLVSSSPQGCVRHPAGHSEIPTPQAPRQDSEGHCQSSGITVSSALGYKLYL